MHYLDLQTVLTTLQAIIYPHPSQLHSTVSHSGCMAFIDLRHGGGGGGGMLPRASVQ